MSEKEPITVVFAANNEFVQFTAVAILSIYQHLDPCYNCRIIVIENQISEKNKLRIERLVKRCGGEIVFANAHQGNLMGFHNLHIFLLNLTYAWAYQICFQN